MASLLVVFSIFGLANLIYICMYVGMYSKYLVVLKQPCLSALLSFFLLYYECLVMFEPYWTRAIAGGIILLVSICLLGQVRHQVLVAPP